ncbi:MAG TPA: helix-turn-helix transcriptional regulator [Chloroflexota bacterium]|nr:helix-turn-helix transcriptional regulator [Chloroflexota bacterium]
MPEFAPLLKAYREARGLAQRALSREAEINPAIISRMESGDRGPSGPEQVLAIARALRLAPYETDRLLLSAGFWPEVYLRLGAQDETLLAVARVLASETIDRAQRDRFRRIVTLLVQQWLPEAAQDGAGQDAPPSPRTAGAPATGGMPAATGAPATVTATRGRARRGPGR